MTVLTQKTEGVYLGDGAAASFATGITVDAASDLKVWVYDETAETKTLKTLGVDYNITDLTDPAGVTLVIPISGSPLSATEQAWVERDSGNLQNSDFLLQRGYAPEATQQEFDRLSRRDQETRTLVERSLRIETGGAVAAYTPVDGRAPVWDAANNAFKNGPDLGSVDDAATSAAAAAASATAAAASETAAAAAANSLLEWKGAWVTSTAYAPSDLVHQGGSAYVCLIAHTSGTFSTDLAAMRWEIFAQQGSAGAGSGDVLAANNGSDFLDAATVRSNIGVVDASETVKGLSERATTAEAEAGTDNARHMTPKTTKEAILEFAQPGRTAVGPVASTSGTAINFNSLPVDITKIEICFYKVSLSGSNNFLIQLSTGTTYKTADYESSSGNDFTTPDSSSGFIVRASSGSSTRSGIVTLLRIPGTNKWVEEHGVSPNSGGGGVDLGGELDGVRIIPSGGNTFDNGEIALYHS